MRASTILATAVLPALLLACTPALNWREASIGATTLVGMFPCKPQTASRTVPLGGHDVVLEMATCETAGATFAIGHAQIGDATPIAPVLQQWRNATLLAVRSQTPAVLPFVLQRANGQPEPVLVQATGVRADGRSVGLQGAWFARDTDVFMALVVAETPGAEMTEPFFSGLRFR